MIFFIALGSELLSVILPGGKLASTFQYFSLIFFSCTEEPNDTFMKTDEVGSCGYGISEIELFIEN